MAIPSWIPVIGGGFDQVAGQNMGWQNFNRQIAEDNMRRAAQAEQAQNAYLANIAQMRNQQAQQDVQNQISADATARQNMQWLAQQAEARRQFDISDATRRNATAAELQWHKDIRDTQNTVRKQEDQTVENFGRTMAPDYHDLASKYEQAQQRYNSLLNAVESKRAELEQQYAGKIEWNPKTKEFSVDHTILDPDEKSKAQVAAGEANTQLIKKMTEADTAAQLLQTHANSFADIQKRAGQYGLEGRNIKGRWLLYSPKLDKTFGTPAASENDSSWQETTPGSGWLKPVFARRPTIQAGKYTVIQE